jgi:CBS-domain-containing membrane protein
MAMQYVPVVFRPLSGPTGLFRPSQDLPERVKRESPAVMSMTDLLQVSALTVEPNVSINHALTRMKEGGVRLLFVTNPQEEVLGLITSTDIQGEKPLQLLKELRMSYDEVLVRDIMTPADGLEVIALGDVMKARVGDIVETLRHSGRRHALVVDTDTRTGRPAIRGIFSATLISNQLGVAIETVEVASTFAEVGAALAH